MEKAIIGKKLGMSQIFTEEGEVVPVTVVEAGPCAVVQIKTTDKDGYNAVKVGFEDKAGKRTNQPDAGQFKKAGISPKKVLKEFKFDDCGQYKVGDEYKCDIFVAGDQVDVVGLTKGRGFTGTIQRWNTHRGPMGHGSGYHRGVGSLSANSSPGRVFKNKKMPGQYGHEQVTIQNLKIVKVDADRNVLLVSGGIPGPKNSIVVVKTSCKNKSSK